MLNLSRETHCRNEPIAYPDSSLARLPSQITGLDRIDMDAAAWDEAVEWTAARMGQRDPPNALPKTYIWDGWRRLGVLRVVKSRRARRVLSRVLPSLSDSEWLPPRWLIKPQAFRRALPVFQLHGLLVWILWVLEDRADVHVLHLIRHPGGFLNSWMNRFLRLAPYDTVVHGSRERLRAIAEGDPQWREWVGPIDPMTVQETELWFWRYHNELIYNAGRGAPNYRLLVYEQLVENSEEHMRGVYAWSGLAWEARVAAAIGAMSSNSSAIARKWRDKVGAEYDDLFERVLATSSLKCLWSG